MTNIKKSFHFIIYLLLLLLSLSISTAFAAKIQVAVDRNPININDSFQIIFTAQQSPDDDPDFSPLERDFTVLNQSQSQSSSWINGKTSSTQQWTLNVMAKNTGNVVIPAIKFGSDSSDALPILVNQDSATTNNVDSNEDLFLKVEVTPETVYVQSQVLYTLRLYRRVDITQARLSEPELADAVVEKLAEDSSYNTQINGVEYAVTERKYAIFPQKSGRVSIKPLELVAEVLTTSRPSFGFFSPQMTRSKRVLSNEITLDVKPVPATFTGGHWLSAEQLDVKEEWSGDKSQIKVGEPLTRTLRLVAKGATVGSLPELNSAKTTAQLKTYADQPVLKEEKTLTGLLAFREEKIALIPEKAGSYTLPALEIPWFNTQSQRMEIAKIPETTITAIASSDTPPAVAQNPPIITPSKTVTPPSTVQAIAPTDNIWFWIALFSSTGWLLTLAYFLLHKRTAKLPVVEHNESATKSIHYTNVLKKACAANDAQAAKTALLAWGQQQFNVTSLGAIANFCHARLRDEILLLNQVLYGKDAQQWQGKKLFQTFTENKARAKLTTLEDKSLEPLHRL